MNRTQQRTRRTPPPPPRRCKGCRRPEQRMLGGLYSNIAPLLGYCADCITRAMREGER